MPKKRGRIIRMDRWEVLRKKSRLSASKVPCSDLKPHLRLHRIGDLFYFSFFKRTKSGIPFEEIKKIEENTVIFADECITFLRRLIYDFSGWCIITTPERRSLEGFHFSSEVCGLVAAELGIPFYDHSVRCVNKSRLQPEFHLLRPINERKVVLFDDIITTGSTLSATVGALGKRDLIISLIGINNR